MKQLLYIITFIGAILPSFAQKRYKLYVEGDKDWAYRENNYTDFVYDFCIKDFNAITKLGIVVPNINALTLEEIYDQMVREIPEDNKSYQLSLYFGKEELSGESVFFLTFFEGNLVKTRKDPFFQVNFLVNSENIIYKYEFITANNDKSKLKTYKEPAQKEKLKYQQDVMKEYSARATEKGANQRLKDYINTRKRWKNLIVEE